MQCSINRKRAIPLAATEGVPLNLDLFRHDADGDGDILNWKTGSLLRGMTMNVSADGSHAMLNWTPDLFAVQDGNTGMPAMYVDLGDWLSIDYSSKHDPGEIGRLGAEMELAGHRADANSAEFERRESQVDTWKRGVR